MCLSSRSEIGCFLAKQIVSFSVVSSAEIAVSSSLQNSHHKFSFVCNWHFSEAFCSFSLVLLFCLPVSQLTLVDFVPLML